MNLELSNLRWGGHLPPSKLPKKGLVFVHGIFSSHTTFVSLVSGLVGIEPSLDQWGKYYFDYDFYRPIAESGRDLSESLQRAFPDKNIDITVVGHSMGGL